MGSCEEVEGEFPAVRWTAGAQAQDRWSAGVAGRCVGCVPGLCAPMQLDSARSGFPSSPSTLGG